MSKKEVLHENESSTGLTRVRRNSRGEIIIDSYYGDVRDKDNHDRLSLNVTTGQVSGHGYGHSDSFDTSKDKSKEK